MNELDQRTIAKALIGAKIGNEKSALLQLCGHEVRHPFAGYLPRFIRTYYRPLTVVKYCTVSLQYDIRQQLQHEGESMPVIITYELEGGSTADRNRLQSMFERLGWENLGGSAYRYPRLGTGDEHPTEDWLNHVIPALMLFRCFFVQPNKNLKKYTLDVQTSTGLNEQTNLGSKPIPGDQLLAEDKLCTPSQGAFGRANLIEWLDDVVYPY